MNIAILVPALENKGPIIVAKDICVKFCDKGYQCEIFYFKAGGNLQFPCKTTKISLTESVDFSKFDIIHIHCLRPAIYIWLHKFAIEMSKVVVTLHQPITFFAYSLAHNVFVAKVLSWISKPIYRSFKNVVVLSEAQAKMAESILGYSVTIIRNGRDISVNEISAKDDVPKIEQLAHKYKIIGTTSVLTKRKGLEQMVKALPLLPDCAFICVGDGPELNTLKQLANSLGVEAKCLWLGYRHDAVSYLPYFDAYVMCTRSEGFPLSFIEAAGTRRACVLSDIEILKCIVPEDCVRFYQLDNIESLADNIRLTLDNKELYGAKLFEYYKRALTATIMAQNYESLFKNIICYTHE